MNNEPKQRSDWGWLGFYFLTIVALPVMVLTYQHGVTADWWALWLCRLPFFAWAWLLARTVFSGPRRTS